MKLYIARHGRTNYNDLHLCNSDPAVDVHLTMAGAEQAEALADKLKQVQIKRIFISELKRTKQTASVVNRFHDLEVEVDARLNDQRSGFEGKPFAELTAALDAADNRWTARFNGGESVEDIKERVASFIEDLRTRDYDTVLIITSLWVIQAMFAVVQGISNEEAWALEAEQGSFVELEI